MAQVTPRPLGTTRPPASAPASPDWTVQAADTIESVVGTIRDKTVVPATTIARGLVYGLVAAVLGIVILVLLVTGAFRLLANYLPGWFADKAGRRVWASYVILGGIFTIFGLFLLRKANARPADDRG